MATLVERRGDPEHRVRREEHKWGDQWKQLRVGEQERKNQRFVVSVQVPSGGLVQASAGLMLKGCRSWRGISLPETIRFISSDGHQQSWFISSQVEGRL